MTDVSFDAARVREDFPVLARRVRDDKPLVYLDNAATAQKPRAVLEAMDRYYREANARIRTEMERGVFDIESVRTANAELIATIEDSLRIADEGKARRAAAEMDLQKMEAELRQTLSASRARAQAPTSMGAATLSPRA